MNSTAMQAALLLFGVALPVSMACWIGIVASAGALRERDTQPFWYRFVLDRISDVSGDADGGCLGGPVAIIFLLLFNILPVTLLVRPIEAQSFALALLYFIAQVGLLVPVLRAIAAEKAKGS